MSYTKVELSKLPSYNHGRKKHIHSHVSNPMEGEGCDHDTSLWIYLVAGINAPMRMVHPPPIAAWPQESPRLVPWEIPVSIEQSSCECSRASAPHPNP